MADILTNLSATISSGLKGISQQNNQFKTVAAQQNNSITRFIKDIGRFFASQAQQQNNMNSVIGDLAQTTATNSGKIDQTNSLLRDSISVQNQMLVELRSFSNSLKKFAGDINDNQTNNSSILGSIAKFLGVGAVGAAAGIGFGAMGGLGSVWNSVQSTATNMGSGFNYLTNAIGGGQDSGTGAAGGTAGYLDTTGSNQRGAGGNRVSVAEMTRLAKNAGFNNEQAAIMGAIGAAESGGVSQHSHASLRGDDSYGLWQINMIGNMGPTRREQFGISSNDQLYDNATNAKAAKKVFDEQGFAAWSTYTSGKYLQYLGTAQKSLEQSSSTSRRDNDVDESQYKNQPQDWISFLQERSRGADIQGLNPVFGQKLAQAISAAEKITGQRAKIVSGYRSTAEQSILYQRYKSGIGGLAAPPGRSRHERGNAVDLAEGPTREVLRRIDSQYGIEDLFTKIGKDMPHFQLSGSPTQGGITGENPSSSFSGYEGSPSASATGPGGMFGGENNINSFGGILNQISSAFSGTQFAPLSGLLGGLTGAMNQAYGGLGNLTSAINGGILNPGIGSFGGIGNIFGSISSILSNIGSFLPSFGKENKEEKQDNDVDEKQYRIVDSPTQTITRASAIQNAAAQSDSMMFNVASALQNQNVSQPPAAPQQNSLPNRNDQGRYSISGGLTSSTSWYQQLAGKINYDEVMKLKGGVYA